MDTGVWGSFAFPWSATETDGRRDAPLSAVSAGASWCWHGRALRLDGPDDVLPLRGGAGAEVDTDIDRGLVVTDGSGAYVLDVVAGRRGALCVVRGSALPAPGREHWVVRSAGLDRPLGRGPTPGVLCFTPGTRIAVPGGARPVETLVPGDRVLTRDGGTEEILWTGARRMSAARLMVMPGLRPVRIAARAIEPNAPETALTVSPRHRVLLRGGAVRALFGEAEVLAAAEDLLDHAGIRRMGAAAVAYVHIMLPRHGIVTANGLACETLHPEDVDLGLMAPGDRSALAALAPPGSFGGHARRILSAGEAAILRHGLARAG